MLKIYFDGVLINSDNYLSLKQSGVMFDDNDSFSLGTTLARQFILVVPKSVFPLDLQEVKIEYLEDDYADLIVDSFEIKEGGGNPTVSITLVDRMVLSNFDYDCSSLVPCTTKDILIDICDKIGVEWGQTSFVNDDVVVDYYDNTITAREYLGYIAELNGGYARIEQDGKLYLRNYSNVNYTVIDPNLCEDIIVGQEHNVERIVFNSGILQYETSNDTSLETLYINSENVFINDESVFNKIVPKIIDFKYYNLNTGRTYALNDVMSGDVFGVNYNGVQYYTISQLVDFNFMGIWVGTYNLMLNSKLQEETQNKGINTLMKSIRISVDRIDQIVSTQVIEIGDLDEKYTELQQTVDGLTSSVGTVHFGNIYINSNGEMGNYFGWSFPNTNTPMYVFGGLYALTGMTQFTNFEIVEDNNSLAGSKISFFGNGKAIQSLAPVINDRIYSFKTKRVDGTQTLTIVVNEYDIDRNYIKNQTFPLPSNVPQEFTLSEFDSNTAFVSVEWQVSGVTLNDRLEFTETMFAIGQPKDYFVTSDNVRLWAESQFDVQAGLIQGVTEEVNIIDGKINNTTVKITPSNGVEIWNNNGRGLTVYDDSNEKAVELTSTGHLRARYAEFIDAIITGNLTAGTIAGLLFNNSEITFPNGNLRLNSATNAIEFGNVQMTFQDDSTDGQGVLIKDKLGNWENGVFIHVGGGIRAKEIRPTVSSIGTIQDLNITGANRIDSYRVAIGNRLESLFNGSVDIGQSSYRFRTIYLTNQPNVSSDTRQKHAIQDIPSDLIEEISKVEPKMYLQHNTWHFGYIAQDIERALYKWATSKYGKEARYYVDKFAMLHKDESYLSLLYGEIVVLKEKAMSDRMVKLEKELQDIKELLKEEEK